MANSVKVVRVFIGSPGGLEDERKAARDVEHEVNLANSDYWGCSIRIVGWEDTIPGHQRPQSKINEDLDKCDYFIGVLWNRWGTRPGNSGNPYTSGFEEEYCRARKRIADGLMKDLAIYFKTVTIPSELEPGTDLKKVMDFRQQCIDEKELFFRDFLTVEDFQGLVRAKLIEIGWRETELTKHVTTSDSPPELTPSVQNQSELNESGENRLIDSASSAFIARLAKRPATWEETEAHEVARFRLIAGALTRSGNDEQVLGNHDANLIFQHYRNSQLPQQEVRALADCGIAGFHSQNVPLWHWLSADLAGKDRFEPVRMAATFSSESSLNNAVQILLLGKQEIPFLDEYFTKERLLGRWLSDRTDEAAFNSIVEFLADHDNTEIIPIIERAAQKLTEPRKDKVESAIVSILSKFDANSALERCVSKQILSFPPGVTNRIFRNEKSLTTQALLKGVASKSDELRFKVVRALVSRDALRPEDADVLLSDSNYEIRFLAIKAMERAGKGLPLELVRKVLVRGNLRRPLGLFTMAGVAEDTTYYDQFVTTKLLELDLHDLQQRVAKAGLYCEAELRALYEKYGTKIQTEVRSNLNDQFISFFEERFQVLQANPLMTEKSLAQTRGLELFLRQNFCSTALDAVCRMQKRGDLELFRSTVDKIGVYVSADKLHFLSKFGEWSDLERLKKLKENYGGVTTLLAQSDKYNVEKAKAILAIAKNRVADVLQLDWEFDVRRQIVAQLASRTFSELGYEAIKNEFSRENDSYRAIVAIKCVLCFGKSRVTSILDHYISGSEHRYYNVIHWLDLGASFPPKLARSIALRALTNIVA